MYIWGLALVLYLLFLYWYDGIRKPLRADEIERFMAVLHRRVASGLHTPDTEVIRAFMEQDDGREFVMVNLLKTVNGPAIHPETREEVDPGALLSAYFRPFMARMFRRAGHPVITGRVTGGYLDALNTPADPGWTGAGLVRYRSRRDAMLSSLANDTFDEIFQFKTASIDQTFAVPTRTMMGLYASPRVTAALLLSLIAALLQLALT